MTANAEVPLLTDDQRRDVMKAPDEVSAMLRLKALGWGSKRIAAELGCARNTVRRWLAEGEWRACASPSRSKKLDGLSDWLGERFRRHGGNADVVRQELASEKGIVVSLRTVERAVAPLRRELVAAARATLRFETHAGRAVADRLRRTRVAIGGVRSRSFCSSRRSAIRAGCMCARMGTSGRQLVRRAGERVPRLRRGAAGSAAGQCPGAGPAPRPGQPRGGASTTAACVCPALGFPVRACAPYRARTKGKDERGVGYVKRNAIAGRRFASWAALEAHLEAWTREIADAADPRHDGRDAAPSALSETRPRRCVRWRAFRRS